MVLSYREVVTVYTRAGGSYVVARENFGPRVAQVAAVALLIDYVVTVAVQTAAGTAAILSAFPALARPLGDTATLLLITVARHRCSCATCNLRGVREDGRAFALPTYLFSGVGRPDDRRRAGPRGVRRRPAARHLGSPGPSTIGHSTGSADHLRAPSSSCCGRSPTAAPR